MKNSNIYFLEVEKEDEKRILKKFPGAKTFSGVMSEVDIIANCQEAEVLCPFIYSKISGKVISSLPKLKFIVTRSVGYDHIDLKTADEKGVIVCNIPDYGSYVIAEHVFALLLSGLRHIGEGEQRVEKKNKFNFQGLRGTALNGKTMGIIGIGKIGKNVARIASLGFLMDVLAYDPHPDKEAARENHFKYAKLDTIWKKADIISLHCPLVPTTKHLLNNKSIAQMKDGVVIVNTSRGGVIETKALIKALKSGKVSNALLDVLEHEKNISQNRELLKLKGVIVTPHIAFYADDSMQKMYDEAFASIRRYLNKEKMVHRVIGV